jgi:hypothetical protein
MSIVDAGAVVVVVAVMRTTLARGVAVGLVSSQCSGGRRFQFHELLELSQDFPMVLRQEADYACILEELPEMRRSLRNSGRTNRQKSCTTICASSVRVPLVTTRRETVCGGNILRLHGNAVSGSGSN